MRQVLLRIGIPDIALVTTNGAFDYNLGGSCAREGSGDRGHTFTMRLFLHSVERELDAFAGKWTLRGTPGTGEGRDLPEIFSVGRGLVLPVNCDYGFGVCGCAGFEVCG